MIRRLKIWLLCVAVLTVARAQNILPDNMVTADCTTNAEVQNWGIVQGSSSQSLSHMYAQPYIGDIDNDGQTEIVTVGYYDSPTMSSSIIVYSPNLQLKYTINTSPMYVYGGYPLAVGDVDRDGVAELFVQNKDGFLRCYHYNGTLLWTSNESLAATQNQTPNLILADVNGDSIPEIWSMQKIFNAVSGVALMSVPELIGYSHLYMGSGGESLMPIFADFDNDGILELAGGNKVYKLNITNSSGTTGNSATLWKTITANGVGDGLTSAADIDLDGYLDLVVVQNGCMYAWKPYSGAGSSPELIASCSYSSSTAGSRALLTDVDNDGYPEILFTFAYGITAYRYMPATQSLQQMWSKNTSDGSGATTMTAFDFNQDGSVEIVYRDGSDLRIIDGTTGNNISTFACVAPTAVEYPAIVDLNRDGQAEIIASSSTYDINHDRHAKLLVFHSPANTVWAPARYVWNQHAYNVVNVNNDLTIPAVNFNPATPFTDLQGVVRRPFNNFLQQATTLDQYGRPFSRMLNVSATADTSITYGNGTFTYSFRFCNTGGRILENPFSITYYADSYRGPVIRTETVNSALSVDNCMTRTAQFTEAELLAFPGLEHIVVAVNDNGTGVAQTGGQQEECDTTDNFFVFSANPCHIPTDTVTADICVREPYSDENFNISTSETGTAGTSYYRRTFQVGGCDSVIVLKLRVHPRYDLHFSETIPEGTTYSRYGMYLHESMMEGRSRIDTSITYQSKYGCDSIVNISIQVATNVTLYLPNAITPSKADGQNDYFFIPEKIRSQMDDFKIVIYNRWGEMVFYSTDKAFAWHGDYKGKIFYNSVYRYVIRYSDHFGEEFTVNGTITVL
ncbi:MAG: VCBS repeat-containing protein [Bacteroidales bacterium]|nr:VCBS repeat-containing protein [Bacteroidales bacterium]